MSRWLTVCAAALCLLGSAGLAWSAGYSLAASVAPSSKDVHSFTFHAAGIDDRHPDAADDQAWLYFLVADGRRVSDADVQATGTWERRWSSLYPMYVHDGGTGPASLTFRGRQAIAAPQTSPWSGRASWRVDEAAPVPLDLYSRVDGQRVVGHPAVSESSWITGLTAALLVAAFAWLRPWRCAQRTRAWLVAHLVAVHVLAWSTQWIGINEDSRGYVESWGWFQKGTVTYFPPGYGALLGLADLAPGIGPGTAATLLQHALMVASVVCLAGLLDRLVPRVVTSTWLLLVTFASPVLFLPQCIMSENAAVVSVVVALWCSVRFAETRSIGHLLAAGATIGWGVMARGLPILMVPAMLLVVLAENRSRAGLRRTAMLLLVSSIGVALPMLWSVAHGGKASVSTGLGRHLYNRVICEQGLLDENAPATSKLRALVPDIRWREHYHWDVASKLTTAGVPYDDCDTILGDVAREGLRSSPFAYFTFSFGLAWRDLVADPCSLVNWYAQVLPPWPAYENPPLLAVAAPNITWRLAIDAWFAFAWPVLCWGAAAALLVLPFLRRRCLGLALYWAAASYILACGFLEYHLNRYNVAITPLVIAVAVLPFALCRRRSATEPSEPAKSLESPELAVAAGAD